MGVISEFTHFLGSMNEATVWLCMLRWGIRVGTDEILILVISVGGLGFRNGKGSVY